MLTLRVAMHELPMPKDKKASEAGKNWQTAMADVVAKNRGDFRRRNNHDSYQKAFGRLLRALKAEV